MSDSKTGRNNRNGTDLTYLYVSGLPLFGGRRIQELFYSFQVPSPNLFQGCSTTQCKSI